jgi:AraC family L-rhamnose operon transcriptional activator RhaR
MRRFHPVLIDRAHVRVPGLHVLRFAVHRHLAEHATVERHRHAWSQAIVYLAGSGRQLIGASATPIQAGSVVVVPAQQLHGFRRHANRPPLSVLIDFRLKGVRHRRPVVATLTGAELTQVQQAVRQLQQLQRDAGEALKWEGAVPVLQVLLTVLRAAGWAERLPLPAPSGPSISRRLVDALNAPTLAEAIRQSGYHRDHLNRLMKAETGLTLGQFRTQQRLGTAQKLLRQGYRVGRVAEAVGLPDAGYFARWFRRQTGQTPSAWRRTGQ